MGPYVAVLHDIREQAEAEIMREQDPERRQRLTELLTRAERMLFQATWHDQ